MSFPFFAIFISVLHSRVPGCDRCMLGAARHLLKVRAGPLSPGSCPAYFIVPLRSLSSTLPYHREGVAVQEKRNDRLSAGDFSCLVLLCPILTSANRYSRADKTLLADALSDLPCRRTTLTQDILHSLLLKYTHKRVIQSFPPPHPHQSLLCTSPNLPQTNRRPPILHISLLKEQGVYRLQARLTTPDRVPTLQLIQTRI